MPCVGEHHQVGVVIAISGDEQQRLGVLEVLVEDVRDVLRRELHHRSISRPIIGPSCANLPSPPCDAAVARVLAAQSGPNDARAREIYKQLIEINTTDTPAGNVTKAAEAVAARLKAAGFPAADVQVLGPDPRKGNLVARYRGTGAAQAAPAARPPRRRRGEARGLVVRSVRVPREGRLLLRPRHERRQGDGVASSSANLIRLKEEGFTPDRDLILALTADEEGGKFNGVEWLVKNHSDLIDAELRASTKAAAGR